MSELAIFRMRQGISQREMANRTGINVTLLSSIERRRHVPNKNHVNRILEAYGIERPKIFSSLQGWRSSKKRPS